jgi:hypothetical protein
MKKSSQLELRNGTDLWNSPPLSQTSAEPQISIERPGGHSPTTIKVGGGVGRLLVSLWMLFLLMASGTGRAQELYEGFYSMINEHPSGWNGGWFGWSQEAQGLAHDANHWFITQNGYLWKVPVTQDLTDLYTGTPGKRLKWWKDVPDLNAAELCHFGDPDYHDGYVFVPVEHIPSTDGRAGVAVFDGDTLDFITHQLWPGGGTFAGWCAMDDAHVLYSAWGNPTSTLDRYAVDWAALTSIPPVPFLTPLPSILLWGESGEDLAVLNGNQGGEFSESGDLLYIVDNYRIHVFDTTTYRRLRLSCNPKYDNCVSQSFIYRVDPTFGRWYEAEGLTIWDLDAHPGAPANVKGQLHVVMLNNNDGVDSVDIKHYGSKIYVDKSSAVPECPPTSDEAWPCGCGSVGYPFHTLASALAAGGAGSKIVIRGGTYPENISFATKMQLQSWDGNTVTIGR